MYPRELDDIFDIEEAKMAAQLPSACVASVHGSAPQNFGACGRWESKVVCVLSPKSTFLGTTLKYVFLETRPGKTYQRDECELDSRTV